MPLIIKKPPHLFLNLLFSILEFVPLQDKIYLIENKERQNIETITDHYRRIPLDNRLKIVNGTLTRKSKLLCKDSSILLQNCEVANL